jgi:outer membrane protein assembly factor BamB
MLFQVDVATHRVTVEQMRRVTERKRPPKYTVEGDGTSYRIRPLGRQFAGAVTASDTHSGEEFWTIEFTGKPLSQPLLQAGTLYIASTDRRIYALDVTRPAWRWAVEPAAAPNEEDRQLVLMTDSVLVVRSDHSSKGPLLVQGLNDQSGQVIWRRTLFERAHLDFAGTSIFVAEAIPNRVRTSQVSEIDTLSGRARWTVQGEVYDVHQDIFAGANGTVFVRGEWYLSAYRDGRQLWQVRTDKTNGSSLLHDGMIYCLCRRSRSESTTFWYLAAIPAETGEISEIATDFHGNPIEM